VIITANYHDAVFTSYQSNSEVAKQKMIDANQRMLEMNSQGEEGSAGGGLSPSLKRHLGLQIKTLENAPRDADKLRRLLQINQRQKGETEHIEDTQRLVTEIEMLRFVLYWVAPIKEGVVVNFVLFLICDRTNITSEC
jgi:DNA polymerase I-like protein with 3'-5' exonuclease and polymerase domains